jgi:phosphohistidine phosphatase
VAAAKRSVLLVRHGKAEDSHPLGDAARALTDEGRQEFRELARKIAGHVKLDGILTSPAVRAVQTAELLADACGVGEVRVCQELDVDDASARSIEALARAVGPGWALVGHNPSMAEALAHLTSRGVPQFRKGAIVALTPTPSLPWHLEWATSPGRKLKQSLD